MVKRVHELIRPKDNDDDLFADEDVTVNKNFTHTIHKVINTDTYTNCQGKPEQNLTRSVFARTGNVKTSTKNMLLPNLTKHLKLKKGVQEELSFSAQVSELFNAQVEEKKPYIFHLPVVSKLSLRKVLLINQREFPFMKKLEKTFVKEVYGDQCDEKENQDCVLDGTASLQISGRSGHHINMYFIFGFLLRKGVKLVQILFNNKSLFLYYVINFFLIYFLKVPYFDE